MKTQSDNNLTHQKGPLNHYIGLRGLMWAFLFFPYLRPARHFLSPSVIQGFRILGYVSIAITILMFLYYRLRMHDWIAFVALTYVLAGLSTLTMDEGGDFESHVSQAVEVLSFIVLLDIGITHDTRNCLNGFCLIAAITIILCTLSMFRYRNSGGMRRDVGIRSMVYGHRINGNWYYLGHDTGSIFTMFPCLAIMFIRDVTYRNDVTSFSLICYYMTLAACIYCSVTTASIALMVFIALFDLTKRYRIRFFSYSFLHFGYILASIGLTYFNSYRHFMTLITKILRKSSTLTGRVRIWAGAIRQITEYPFLGSGTLRNRNLARILGINHCHNMLLELLFRGGIIGFSFFCISIYLCGKPMKKLPPCRIKSVLLFAIVAYSILCLTDGYYFSPFPFAIYVAVSNCMTLYHEHERVGQ